MRRQAARVDAATPADRDRVLDAFRAVAILGVVLGHWLVGVIVVTDAGAHIASPLQHMPGLSPVTWLFQLLSLFFFAGGWAASSSLLRAGHRAGIAPASYDLRVHLRWLGARLDRMLRPVAVLMLVLAAVGAVLAAAGWSAADLRTVGLFVVSPLWFLPVYLILTVLTPWVMVVVRRFGAWAALVPAALVGVLDVLQYAPWSTLPEWIGMPNLILAWLVPYLLGVAFALGRLTLAAGPVLLVLGAVTAAVLIGWADYPVSMTGVTGAQRSNMAPTSLLVAAVGVAQLGIGLLLYRRLARLLRAPLLWTSVVMLNLVAMTVYLWHETALVVTQFGLRGVGVSLPALDGAPLDGDWLLGRLAMIPVFFTVLLVLVVLFRRWEAGSAPRALRAARTALGRRATAGGHSADHEPSTRPRSGSPRPARSNGVSASHEPG